MVSAMGPTHCVWLCCWQYVAIHDTPVVDVVEKACSLLPSVLQEPCDALVEKYG